MGFHRLLVLVVLFIAVDVARAEPVRVRFREGLVHGFLVLKATDGAPLAHGDLIQTAQGDRVTSRLVFRFRDGSLFDETTIFSQRDRFRLISNHLIEKGPSFPQAIDMSIDAVKGTVTVRYDDDGEAKTETDDLEDVPDLANGLLTTLLKNVGSAPPPTGLSMIVATPKPRVVRLTITRAGADTFDTGGLRRKATHFVVKAELGGLTGVVAKLLDKQPPDAHVWVLTEQAPAFMRAQQPMFAGAPLWTIELVGPAWPPEAGAQRRSRTSR